MGAPWEYHANWCKSGGKSQEPCDFTHMWDIKLKATEQQQNQKIDTDNSMAVTRGKEVEAVKGKGGQINSDR